VKEKVKKEGETRKKGRRGEGEGINIKKRQRMRGKDGILRNGF